MWDLPYFNLGNNLCMCTTGGASTNQESTAIAETLAVLISKGALSRLPCLHRHLATTVQVPMLLIQTCSSQLPSVSHALLSYRMWWCYVHISIRKRSLSCPASCWSGGCTQQDRTGHARSACWAAKAWEHLCRGVLERQWNPIPKHYKITYQIVKITITVLRNNTRT